MPDKHDKNEKELRDLRNALRVALEDRDKLREQRDNLENKIDKLESEVSESRGIKALFAQLIAFIEEQGNVAYIASLRIALIASAFNAFAWVAAFLLIAFDNPTAAYFAAAGGFGATGVLFFWSAFNRESLERIKNVSVRRRRWALVAG